MTDLPTVMADVGKIAVVRVSDTPAIVEVREYIKAGFDPELWTVLLFPAP